MKRTIFRIIFLSIAFIFFISFFIPFFSTQALEYQRVSLGDTIRIGEFLYEDDYTASTADCTLTIYDSAGTQKYTGTMTENANGWHYHDYAVGGGEALGNWPTSMACGTAGVDLVIVDKTFTVIPAKTTTDGWTVTLSDFGGTTASTSSTYKAKLQVLNYAAVPTDADSLPTVVITDSAGTVVASASANMTKNSSGSYSYSHTIGGSAIGGVWETVVSVVINGQTVKRNDYWSISSSPADVQIIEITDKVIPEITANVRIDNMGNAGSDFYYVYCIVSSAEGLCGGSNDIDSASATAYIAAGSFINLSLTLDGVPTEGTYWFKVKARALAETNWAASTQQFIAEPAAASITLTIDGTCNNDNTCDANATAIFGTLSAGTANDANVRIKTDSTTTITLAIGRKRSSPTTTLASSADATNINISDTAGGIDVFDANCTDGTGPAIWKDASSTGLGFSLWAATENKDTTCWGTGTNDSDANNKYAALQASSSASTAWTTTSSGIKYASIGYSLDVTTTQQATSYIGDIIFTATTTP